MPSHDRNRRRELWRRQARQRQAESTHILGRLDALRAEALASVKVVYDREAGVGEIPGYLIERMRGGELRE